MESTLKKWHEFFATKNPAILNELLTKDVVFHSPVVWKPQEGKMITTAYLLAAMKVFAADDTGFQYVGEVSNEQRAVLEFTCVIDDITINGVDIIDINEEGKITSFKVMIRPLKAVNKIHKKMAEMLEQMK
ncbi:MAG: nuclear transport factor 2 family protein [Cyclobacteriaceae bacterium]